MAIVSKRLLVFTLIASYLVAPRPVHAVSQQEEVEAARKLLSRGDVKAGLYISRKRINENPKVAAWHEVNAFYHLHDEQFIESVTDVTRREAEAAESLDDKDTRILATHALIYFYAKEYYEALRRAKSVLKLDKNDKRAQIVALLTPMLSGKKKDDKQAVLDACKNGGEETDVYVAATRYFRIKLDQDGLLQVFSIWFKNIPDSAYAYYRRAQYREARRDFQKAAEDYKRSCELNDQYISPLGRYAFCLYKTKKWEEAIKVYDQIVKHERMNSSRYVHRGQCYEALGQYDRAIADYTKGIELEIGTNDTAKQILELKRRDVITHRLLRRWWHLRSACHEKAGHAELALADAKTAVMAWPGDSASLDMRRELYQKTGKWDLALKDLNSLIAMHPRVSVWYKDRAAVLEKLGKLKDAERDRKQYESLMKSGVLTAPPKERGEDD